MSILARPAACAPMLNRAPPPRRPPAAADAVRSRRRFRSRTSLITCSLRCVDRTILWNPERSRKDSCTQFLAALRPATAGTGSDQILDIEAEGETVAFVREDSLQL